MNQAAQQIPSNPARDFANAVLAETDNAREIIDMLHDIAQGIHEDATDHDCISASRILLDRGLGKCPRQSPATNPDPEHSPATDDTDVEPAPYSIRGRFVKRLHLASRHPPSPTKNPSPPGSSPSSTTPSTNPSARFPRHAPNPSPKPSPNRPNPRTA